MKDILDGIRVSEGSQLEVQVSNGVNNAKEDGVPNTLLYEDRKSRGNARHAAEQSMSHFGIQGNGLVGHIQDMEISPSLVASALKDNPDPFSPESLRLSGDFAAATGVRKILTTVPVRKPSKVWFVRTHPHPDYRLQTYVIELKEDSETYLVVPSLWNELGMESTFGLRLFFTAMNRQGDVFLWPVKLPKATGRDDNSWNKSALYAAELASRSWVRVQANMTLGAYDVFQAANTIDEPKWIVPSLHELLNVAFKGKKIDSIDHPVLRRLRGEI